METYWLCFTLLSDATFGRGEGVPGLVDQEVDHDDLGLPYLDGRTLKGLLNEECANVIYSLEQQWGEVKLSRWYEAAERLLGGPGSTLDDDAQLRIGPARPPADLVDAVRQAVESRDASLTPADILDSLTSIRRQTAVSAETGVPDRGTLRAMRVVLRDMPFEAKLTFPASPRRMTCRCWPPASWDCGGRALGATGVAAGCRPHSTPTLATAPATKLPWSISTVSPGRCAHDRSDL